MAKRFRYDVLCDDFNYWAVADAWAKGYNAAKGLKWNDQGAARYHTYSDLHDGYIKGGNGKGFCVVIKIELTKKEQDEIDENNRLRKLKQAKKELELAMKKVDSLS